MKCFRWFLVVGMVVFFVGSAALGEGSEADFAEDFSGGDVGWRQYLDQKAEWVVSDGVLRAVKGRDSACLLYTSPSPRDRTRSRMPSSA